MSEKLDNLAADLKEGVSGWIEPDVEDVAGLSEGGSGAVLRIDSAKGSAILKVIKCELCGNPAEHRKLLREVHSLLRSAGTNRVVPVLTRTLGTAAGNEATLIGKVLDVLPGAGQLDDFLNVYKKNSEQLTDFIFQLKHEPQDGAAHTHTGYLTPVGYPLEKILEYCAQVVAAPDLAEHSDPVTGKPLNVPDWVRYFAKPWETPGGSVTAHVPLRSSELLDSLIKDLLRALRGVHAGGLAHLDVKEENILALAPEELGACPRFVLFDFGSVQEIDARKRTSSSFETTYQYLPMRVQRHKPLTRFTSHQRTPFEFSIVEEREQLTLPEIDLHAVSFILRNFLTDPRYRRISAFLDDDDYETVYAFSELISADFRDDDIDSVVGRLRRSDGNTVEVAKAALERYEAAVKLKETANKAWQQLEGHSSGNRVAHPSAPFRVKLEELAQAEVAQRDLERREPATAVDDETAKALQVEIDVLREAIRESADSRAESWSFDLLADTFELAPIAKTHLVQRLQRIRQLALTYLNPPEGAPGYFAEHTRFDHLVGISSVVRLFLTALLKQSGWFRLRYEREDGLFLLIGAMLHDIGHYPCAHYLEDTDVFKKHDEISRALIRGDLPALWLHTKSDKAALDKNGWERPDGGAVNWPNDGEQICKTNHGPHRSCYLQICDPQHLTELHEAVAQVLGTVSAQPLKDFVRWYDEVKSASKPGKLPKRLAFRVLSSLLSGPIDADKVHYLVHDALNCDVALSAPFETAGFERLLLGLRLAIRDKHDSSTQRFCLGLDEDAVHLAQMVLFVRAAMYRRVYWSSEARAVTTMLRHLVLHGLQLVAAFGSGDAAAEFVGRWLSADDATAKEVARELAAKADEVRPDAEKELALTELWKLLYEAPREEKHFEVCRIYPSDTVAYRSITDHLGPLGTEIGGSQLLGTDNRLLEIARESVAEVIGLELDDLLPGEVLVDVPAQKTSKRGEFPRLALVDQQGFGRPIGELSHAIDDDFEAGIRVIRVFMRPKGARVAREEREEIRRRIIARLS